MKGDRQTQHIFCFCVNTTYMSIAFEIFLVNLFCFPSFRFISQLRQSMRLDTELHPSFMELYAKRIPPLSLEKWAWMFWDRHRTDTAVNADKCKLPHRQQQRPLSQVAGK